MNRLSIIYPKIGRAFSLSILVVIVLAISPNTALGQSSITTDQLIGDWELSYDKSKQEIKGDMKSRMDQLSSSDIDRIKKAYDKRRFVFEEDGRFTVRRKNGQSTTGRWSLEDERKSLKLVYDGGLSYDYLIREKGKNKLVLKLKEESASTMIFRVLQLVKK